MEDNNLEINRQQPVRQRFIDFLREAALLGLCLATGAVLWIVLAI